MLVIPAASLEQIPQDQQLNTQHLSAETQLHHFWQALQQSAHKRIKQSAGQANGNVKEKNEM